MPCEKAPISEVLMAAANCRSPPAAGGRGGAGGRVGASGRGGGARGDELATGIDEEKSAFSTSKGTLG